MAPQELASGKLLLDFPADQVARITINNPRKRNALDHEILDGIAAAVKSLSERCLLLTGTEGMFSAGYDIGGFPEDVFAEEAEKLVAHPFTEAVEAIDAYPFPSVAAVGGHAIGGGLELALACDLRIAATGVKMGMPPAKLGLIYSHTGLRRFIDAIGVARTRELFYTGENLPVERVEQWGLVNRVVGADDLERESTKLAAGIAANAPLSLSGNKRVIGELLAVEADLDKKTEAELIQLRESCFRSEDFREGVKAFGEKRKAQWSGR